VEEFSGIRSYWRDPDIYRRDQFGGGRDPRHGRHEEHYGSAVESEWRCAGFGAGRFRLSSRGTGSDELGNLATVFNSMAGELQDLYSKIRHREARFRALIEETSDLILVANQEGELVYSSPSSLPILGYSPAMLVGRRLRGYAHPEDVPLIDELFGA